MEERKKANKELITNINEVIKNKGIKIDWLNNQTEINWYHRLSGRTLIKVEELVVLSKVLDVDIQELLKWLQ